MNLKKRVILEFDEVPKLIFVQGAGFNDKALYIDGKKVKGIRRVRIEAGIDEITTHEVEYVTHAAGEEPVTLGG